MIREAVNEDIPIINELAKELNYEIYTLKHPFNHSLVYELDGEVIGYLEYALMYERMDINYMVVRTDFRRQKIGSKMLKYLIHYAQEISCENITLEVNETNTAAINLYKSNKFKAVAKRANYYKNDNGLLMIRELM